MSDRYCVGVPCRPGAAAAGSILSTSGAGRVRHAAGLTSPPRRFPIVCTAGPGPSDLCRPRGARCTYRRRSGYVPPLPAIPDSLYRWSRSVSPVPAVWGHVPPPVGVCPSPPRRFPTVGTAGPGPSLLCRPCGARTAAGRGMSLPSPAIPDSRYRWSRSV